MAEQREGGNVIEPKIEEKESDVEGFLRDFREDHAQLGKDLWEAQWKTPGKDAVEAVSDMHEVGRLHDIQLKRTWDVAKPDEKNEIIRKMVKDGDMEILEDLLQNGCFDTLDEKVKEEAMEGLANYYYELLKRGFKSAYADSVWNDTPRDVRGKVMLKLAEGDDQEKEFLEMIVNNEVWL